MSDEHHIPEGAKAEIIVVCPACEGRLVINDIDGPHECRCCEGAGKFPETEMFNRVKDMKTWPDSIRREHCCR
jgi:hypothetical protein